jgi:hypothetical protein
VSLHVALVDDHAELGLSVLAGHRGQASEAPCSSARGATHRNRSVPRLYMHCLNENAAVVHIARKFGMRIVAEGGRGGRAPRAAAGFRRLDRRRVRDGPACAVRLRAQVARRDLEGRQQRRSPGEPNLER